MAELRFSLGFVEDLSLVESDRVLDRVYMALEPLSTLPRYGSSLVPEFAKQRFGTEVLKLTVEPYDIYYHYTEQDDIVEVDGMVPMRRQR